MSLIQSVFLGMVQGLAEFLPISSSGHLVLLQLLFGINPPPFLFDVFLHLSTLIAVIFFFRKKILKLNSVDVQYLVVGTIPALTIGFLLRNIIDGVFSSSLVVGVGLIVTSVLNFSTNNLFTNNSNHQSLDNGKSLLIGVGQVLAFLPGISRSGSTIFVGSLTKLSKKQAFDYSFLLSIPVIIGANILQINKLLTSNIPSINIFTLIAGGTAAFFTSLFSLKLLKKVIKHERYYWFGWYCLFLGLGVVLVSFS